MPRHATKTSYQFGHKMTETEYQHWYECMKPSWEGRKGKRAHKWSIESRQKLSNSIKGMAHPRAKALFSERLHKSGPKTYVVVKVAPTGKWQYKHRFVMEQFIGRKLKKREHVHHVDGNTLNNNIDNLQLLINADHNRTTFAITKWSIKYDCCQSCGTTTKKHMSHGLCSTCYQREKANKLGYWP